jgi:hypothetical protein
MEECVETFFGTPMHRQRSRLVGEGLHDAMLPNDLFVHQSVQTKKVSKSVPFRGAVGGTLLDRGRSSLTSRTRPMIMGDRVNECGRAIK